MANPQHLELLKQGAGTWHRWYKEHYWGNTPDLSGANLSEMDLRDVRLSFAKLEGACFKGSNLRSAYFVQADLRGADLRDADLDEAHLDRSVLMDAQLQGAQLGGAKIRGAKLARANLSEASLSYANLEKAYLNATILRSTDLSFARFGENTFVNVDFSVARGLETIVHVKPANLVDERTQFRAPDDMLEFFPCDTGTSPWGICFTRSMESISAEFPACLLSFADDDRVFAEQLLHDLQASGVFCHAEPYGATRGKLIQSYDKLLLLCSASGLADPEDILPHILREARVKASYEAPKWETSGIVRLISLDRALQNRTMIGHYRRTMWPANDFSGWDDGDIYQQALWRLLDELRYSSQDALEQVMA